MYRMGLGDGVSNTLTTVTLGGAVPAIAPPAVGVTGPVATGPAFPDVLDAAQICTIQSGKPITLNPQQSAAIQAYLTQNMPGTQLSPAQAAALYVSQGGQPIIDQNVCAATLAPASTSCFALFGASDTCSIPNIPVGILTLAAGAAAAFLLFSFGGKR